MSKPLIAVISGIVCEYAERELLQGIIEENKKNGYSTVVLSGIYNIVQEDSYLTCERRIYELVYSHDLSGVILFCESFIVERARAEVASVLQKLQVPLVGIGSRMKEFSQLSIPYINTDEAAELEQLTDHLIDVHGFDDIMMLTGMSGLESSNQRVLGYKRSLQKHGIPFDEHKVIYGDYWMTSGERLANSIIIGKRQQPQAIVCGNNRMAYGLLRRFSEAGIKVPEEITILGYEYSVDRFFYSPPLTCMKRNRIALGALAAKTLIGMITDTPLPEMVSPEYIPVYGSTCSCPGNIEYHLAEQRFAAERLNDIDLNLFCTMEHRMTLCRDMKELFSIIGDYQWIIKNKRSMYLRLYADWYDPNAMSEDLMQSRCVVPWLDTTVFENDRFDLKCLFEREPGAVVCYYAPVFFGNDLFGDIAVMYDEPVGYEDVFRHWLKSVSIGLEYMRLKNDFQYLLSCQSISEYRDSLTGLYNAKGLKRVYSAREENEEPELFCVVLRLFPVSNPVSEKEIARKTQIMLSAARAVRRFCGENAMAGHTDDYTFVCFVQSSASGQQLSELLAAILLCEKHFIDHTDMNSFACAAAACGDFSFSEVLAQCNEQLDEVFRQVQESRRSKNYSELMEIRNLIYASPEVTFSQDNELLPEEKLELYRDRYKKCFGRTFHQDCIAARITRAKYYLAVTQLDIAEISEKCGYLDHKYFQRQFTANTGLPALRYRTLLGR